MIWLLKLILTKQVAYNDLLALQPLVQCVAHDS